MSQLKEPVPVTGDSKITDEDDVCKICLLTKNYDSWPNEVITFIPEEFVVDGFQRDPWSSVGMMRFAWNAEVYSHELSYNPA